MAQTHHYLFDTAGTYNDATGSSNFTNVYGSIASGGVVNQCYQTAGYNFMDPVNAYTSANILPTSGAFSVAFWIKSWGAGSGGGTAIRLGSTGMSFNGYGKNSEFGVVQTTPTFQTKTIYSGFNNVAWTHLAFIWSGTTWTIYRNGSVPTQYGSNFTPNSATYNSSTRFEISCDTSGGGYYIDDLRVYDSAIDSTEVTFLYNSGSGTQSNSSGGTTTTAAPTTTTAAPGSTTTTTAAPSVVTFPSVPSSGQTYTYGNRMWRYNGTGWEIILPRGSSGLLQYNNSNYLAGASGLSYSASGTILTNTAQAATDKALVVKGAASQSANLQEWQNSSGSALSYIDSSGRLNLAPITSGTGNTGELRLLELAANGTHYIGFKAPDAISSNRIWTLPGADGSSGQYLKTDGSGLLAWDGITSVGTVTTGTWSASNIALAKGGTNASLTAVDGAVAYSSSSAIALTAAGASGQILTSSGTGSPTWTYYGGASAIDNPGGRLTLTSGTPVTTANVTSATTLYYTPFVSNKIDLYNGTAWVPFLFSELSISVPTNTLTNQRPKDVFIYSNSGVPTLELGPNWTSDTARATALVLQNGIYVKSGDTTRRYVGTIRGKFVGLDSYMEDSVASRFVWNYYNRMPRMLACTDSTASWTYSTATWRQARATTTNQVDFVVGIADTFVQAEVNTILSNSTANQGGIAAVGYDTTTDSTAMPNGTFRQATIRSGSANAVVSGTSTNLGYPAIGYHYCSWNEISTGVGTTTYYSSSVTGITGFIVC